MVFLVLFVSSWLKFINPLCKHTDENRLAALAEACPPGHTIHLEFGHRDCPTAFANLFHEDRFPVGYTGDLDIAFFGFHFPAVIFHNFQHVL